MIAEIDARTASDEDLRPFWEVEAACHDETNPGEPLRSLEEVLAFLRFQPPTHTSCHWVAGGGFAGLYVHGPTAAFVHLLVDPAHRRRGLGAALADAVLARCRELGVRALHGHHTSEAGAAFARRFGAVDGQRIVRSLLPLRDAELPEPRVPDGWSLATWLGRVPDAQLDALVRARGAMDDAPAPDALDFPTWTAEKQRASEESLRQRDREMRVTVAVRDDGEVGAFTELRVSRGSTLGFTDDTGTRTEFRGRGLARAVKIESLRRLRDDHPEIDVVCTDNAEENVAMRHINESVGFRPSIVETTATLAL
ncbi:MAG TPA: GNAT family N-acetyltransferase [Gaiellaceae bacterium]